MRIKMNSYKYTPSERQHIIYQYLRQNTHKGKVVSQSKLFNVLSQYDIEISVGTFYNDIDTLRRSIFNHEIHYDESLKGYWLANPQFEPYELRLLVDSVQASRFITQRKAEEITAKIKKLTDVDTAKTLNRIAVVQNRVRSMNESVVKDADKIYKAIEEDRRIGFRYFHYTPSRSQDKSYSKKGDPYVVSPFALTWNDGNYYLYAYDGKKFRYFRIDRMERITPPLPVPREGKELPEHDITSSRPKAKVFRMYGGKEYIVKMRFVNHLAGAVVDEFGKDVLMIPTDDKHFTITVPVQISPTFFAWVSTFGHGAKILGPDDVVQKMRKFLQDAADMYEEE